MEILTEQPKLHDRTYSPASNTRIDALRQLSALFEFLPESPDRKEALEDLLRLSADSESRVRAAAIQALESVYPHISENRKKEVWDRLLNLTAYPVEEVERNAAQALVSSYSHLPETEREKAWKELAALVTSPSSTEGVRRIIVRSLPSVLPHLPETGKSQAWEFLLKMAGDETGDGNIRKNTGFCLGMVCLELSENERGEAWEKLLKIAGSEDEKVRREAVKALMEVYPFVPEEGKVEACSDLVRLSEEGDSYVTRRALKVLASLYPELTEENGVEKLYGLAARKAAYARRDTAQALGAAFLQEGNEEEENQEKEEKTQEKESMGTEQAKAGSVNGTGKGPGLELLKLTGDRDSYVRQEAAQALAASFSRLPDKKEVCRELFRLGSATTAESTERRGAVSSLLALYSAGCQGKKRDIWAELLKMAGDKDVVVRKNADEMLSHVFPDLEDKSGAFFDLLNLIAEGDASVRRKASELLGLGFKEARDKELAWIELVRLASGDEDREVRKNAVLAFAVAFPEVPDKEEGWQDLMRLSGHGDSYVRRGTVRVMGLAFYLVRDKTRAWRDMLKLTRTGCVYVKKYAFQSLGKASLWRSLQGTDRVTYIFGLKEAIRYFRAASEISTDTKVPEFYLPFFESLLFILESEQTFRKAGPESERYFLKMEREIREIGQVGQVGQIGQIGEPGKREQLLEKIRQFASLLEIAGDLEPEDLAGKKELLEGCILAFERASELFYLTEEELILAGKLAKKERPDIGKMLSERKIKEALSEIQNKSKAACLRAKGTPTEELACLVSRRVKKWKIKNLDKDRKELEGQLESLIQVLTTTIPPVSENMYIFDRLEEIKHEEDLLERYRKTARFVGLLPGARMPARKVRKF